jgi:tetratricopeptide (TPR) repeat protein
MFLPNSKTSKLKQENFPIHNIKKEVNKTQDKNSQKDKNLQKDKNSQKDKNLQKKQISHKKTQDKKFNSTPIPTLQKKSSQKKEKKIKEVKKLILYPIYPDIDNLTSKSPKKVSPKLQKKIQKPKPPKQENKQVKIIIKAKVESLDDLIVAYNNSPNYTKALKVAKLYFEKKDYNETIKWAKKANKFKPENYESWYIFAKSLIKLGKIKEAKKVLVFYINTYGPNENIEKLLRSIK